MIGFLFKTASLLLMNKIVENNDIAASYDKVSKNYEKYFLDIMHSHNDKVLDLLIKEIRKKQENGGNHRLQILDLACGTGYNSRYLINKGIDADYTLVDLSKGMLHVARKNGMDPTKVNFVNHDMLSFLKGCHKDSFDIIICMWAIKYQPPKKVIRECERVLKREGLMAVIVNTADTLPQVRRLYPKLIIHNWRKIKKVMFDLPNPKSKQEFGSWFTKSGFSISKIRSGRQTFHFQNSGKLAEFLTSTGALAGYDDMIDLDNSKIKMQMISYFNKRKIVKAEHRFVFGVFEKRRLYEANKNAF